MEMRKAFDGYFDKLWRFTEKRYGTNPSVTYTENLNKALLISAPDEDDEVEWHPIEQSEDIGWDAVEESLSIKVAEELKAYLGTYYFLTLSGIYDNAFLNFYPIDGALPVGDQVCRAYNDARIVFPSSETFLIGNAVIDDDDSYFIFYDNAANSVFCYDAELDKRVDVRGSLSDIIGGMEARD